jgi:uncharacterized membrane protein YbhN (UPF0104 family)
MSTYFKVFVYGSLFFLGAILWSQGFLEVPTIHSRGLVALSLLPLIGGFLTGSVAWHRVLLSSAIDSRLGECLASMGLSIFAKYIPGKVWMIVGRAAYLSERRGLPIGELSVISLNDQLISLWVGLVLGAFGLFAVGGLELYGGLVLVSWLALSLVVFSPWVHRTAEKLLGAIARRRMELPVLSLGATLRVLPWFVGYWALWSLGFYLLVAGLSPSRVAPVTALAFPLAATLGVMAVVAPGGLGVREGMLTVSLKLGGIPLPEATTIAVACRLWFLSGEAAFFLAGLAANRRLLGRSSAA